MWCLFATRSISVLKPMLHTSLAIHSIVCKMLVWWLHFDTGFFQHLGVQSKHQLELVNVEAGIYVIQA